jgi:hypothetical protein
MLHIENHPEVPLEPRPVEKFKFRDDSGDEVTVMPVCGDIAVNISCKCRIDGMLASIEVKLADLPELIELLTHIHENGFVAYKE